jgi:amidase
MFEFLEKARARSLSRRSFVAGISTKGIAAILSTRIAPSIGADAQQKENLPWKPDENIFRSASELVRLIRAKEISSEELTRAYLARIAKVNPKLNAVCQLDEKGALAAAREADASLRRGAELAKLHGVPITIKDSFDTKGIVSAGGTEGRRNYVPQKDATVVARLRAAGAIILGKTNTPELTLSYDTDNVVYGRTHNPYNLTFTPGGSSGGAAAILAVGGSALDIGSDTAGSIRIPAHFCGIAGLMPDIRRVSRAGTILPPKGVFGRRTHVGPMARFVEDLILTLSIIAGPDPADPDVIAGPLEDPTKVDITKLRVAYFSESGKARASAEMVLAVRSVKDTLSAAGLKCESAPFPGIEKAAQMHNALNSMDGGKYFDQLLERYGTTKLHPQTLSLLEQARGRALSEEKKSELLREWENIRESSLKFMENFDILICPPCSNIAPPPQLSGFLDYSYSSFFNLLGWPAAVVRVGRTASGMPKGIQIVGRPWKEDEVLAIALFLEKKLGGWKKDFPEQTLVAEQGK